MLENIRDSIALLDESLRKRTSRRRRREALEQAVHETADSIRVLEGGGLHPEAIPHLKKARSLTERAALAHHPNRRDIEKAIREQERARAILIEDR